jgi:zinc metalloprotease ZmpB
MFYLIVGGIVSLSAAPITPARKTDDFVLPMKNADANIPGYNKQPGSAMGKVILWSSEEQGLYQPLGAPTLLL